MRTTYIAKPGEVDRKWYVVDATNVALGRLTSTVAAILRGKNKPTYTPHVDTGDYVIVINAAQVKLTGKKLTKKNYYHHSGYAGGLRTRTAGELMANDPTEVIEHAVKGMLPHNSLGHKQFLKLHVYADANYEQAAQKPEKLDINKLI